MTAALTWDDVTRDAADEGKLSLLDRFVVPPFSILNSGAGYWMDRKRWWLALGIESEIGRGADARAFVQDVMRGEVWSERPKADHAVGPSGGLLLQSWTAIDTEYYKKKARAEKQVGHAMTPTEFEASGLYVPPEGQGLASHGTSVFDPVLCELAYRWFAPEGGTVLDPFAGGSVRGIVASHLGHPYVGVDLSAAQIDANRVQATKLIPPGRPVPEWHVGDSHLVIPTLDVEADLVFTCPPYYDLEVYSDDPADLSALGSYEAFRELYRGIIAKAVARLRPGRFAVIVVSEIRDPKTGQYRGFVPDTIAAFTAAGLRYYNEMILLNNAGSLPIRVRKQFEASRKIGRTHQNVLVFLKGDVPRGWSYDRAAPPDPQIGMFGDELVDPIAAAEAEL